MAPADSEQGQVPPQGLATKRDLEVVPVAEDGPERRVGPSAIQPGIDVGATRQEQAIHVVEEVAHILGPTRREDQRQAAPRLHRPHVVLAQAEDLRLLLGVLDGDPDGRALHIRSGTGMPKSDVSTSIWRTKASTTS